MANRDSQTVVLSRQAIVLVTAVGVGLLTLCYVLGVQVGKQSAALRYPQARGAGEDLQELPASVAEQLKAFQKDGAGAEQMRTFETTAAGAERAPAQPPPAAKPETASEPPKEAPKPAGKLGKTADPKAAPEPRWSLQLVSTPDPAEAQRMATRARDAGFPTVTVKDNGLLKVRLIQTGARDAVDATALKLKNRGFKPFALRTP